MFVYDILQKEIDELDKKYKEAKDINQGVKNRFAKYYNQDINMKNMKAKILSLREKCTETTTKTEDIEKQKQEIQDKIDDLKEKFAEIIEKTNFNNIKSYWPVVICGAFYALNANEAI